MLVNRQCGLALLLLGLTWPANSTAANQPKPPGIGQKAGETRNDNSLKLTLVWCPPGSFIMGSPRSELHRDIDEDQAPVTLTNGFWLGQTEITQGQWEAVMGSTPWKGGYQVKEGSNYPASYVSWEDAIAFGKKLTAQERKAGRLPHGWEYALPTEAQWHYACRAGTKTVYSFGNDETKIGDYGWVKYNTRDIGEKYAHIVGVKKPNPWGLYDMHGNVSEWCVDRYIRRRPGGRNPEVTRPGPTRADRASRIGGGGSWNGGYGGCRSASRILSHTPNRTRILGFRIARVLSK